MECCVGDVYQLFELGEVCVDECEVVVLVEFVDFLDLVEGVCFVELGAECVVGVGGVDD